MSRKENKSGIEKTTNSVRVAAQSTTNFIQNAVEDTTEDTKNLADRAQKAMDNNNENKKDQ